MNTTLTVTLHEVYGKLLAYPSCEGSKALTKIAGTKTLTASTIRAAKAMGFDFRVRFAVGGLEAFVGLAPEAVDKING